MASHLVSMVSTATAKATEQPVTKGSSFADIELGEGNANYVKTMDARLDPVSMCGLEVGDAHIIRNGGGRAADAMRSLIGSQEALQTREIIVIHHEDCGYSHASTPVIQKALKSRTPDGAHPLVDAVALQEFSDPKQSVREDVAFLRTNPLVHPDSMVSGWYYSVQTGELQRVC
ncbi:hypothetical protein C6P46_006880 [Rhodotorula mucilaginosa]|uniref:Carbonic anhydrase n=1 Tax=Rhodotorula mucilaginosa TaxID=5537 RepID=A0A9P7B9E8_RHOMI|nr:hypothetical protein C6P46_006880 [Rhodotorula mucilaginosa]